MNDIVETRVIQVRNNASSEISDEQSEVTEGWRALLRGWAFSDMPISFRSDEALARTQLDYELKKIPGLKLSEEGESFAIQTGNVGGV